jgi:deoxyribodipyrimidine photolyase-like uncharacterized protein
MEAQMNRILADLTAIYTVAMSKLEKEKADTLVLAERFQVCNRVRFFIQEMFVNFERMRSATDMLQKKCHERAKSASQWKDAASAINNSIPDLLASLNVFADTYRSKTERPCSGSPKTTRCILYIIGC